MVDNSAPVTSAIEAFKRWDLDESMSYWAPDSRYSLHLSADLVPFAGSTVGRDNIRRRFEEMERDWEYILFRPGPLRPDPEDAATFHCSHEFLYRNRATGADLSGRCRFVWRVAGGLIASCDEYHDRPNIEANLRLIQGQSED